MPPPCTDSILSIPKHVTCVDRWLYLAMSAKEVLLANGYTDDDAKVVYKRPTDLALIRDVPCACNLLVCDILDDGLLTSGMIPAISHGESSHFSREKNRGLPPPFPLGLTSLANVFSLSHHATTLY